MGAIKDLLLRIKGDSSSLQKETKKAQGVLGKFKKFVGGIGIAIAGAFVVKAIVNFGKKLIDISSQAEEVRAKFNTVFKDVRESANAAADELVESYGLSRKSSEELLSSTGDLLTGLGTEADVALDLSSKVNKLAVDLASFTNFSGGAEGASAALTKALLGERESVKSLGIVVTEQMVKDKLLANGQEKLTGQALLQAKAMATLEIATEQSKNAIGDYARTQDSFANTSRTLTQRLEDVKIMLGDFILPIATKVKQAFVALVPKMIEFIKVGSTKVREVANAFIEVFNNSELLRVAIGAMVGGIKTTFAAIKLIIQNAFLPIKTFGKVIGAILTGDFKAIKGIIQDGFKKGVENIGDFGKKAAENYGNAIKNAKDKFIEPLKPKPEDEKDIKDAFNQAGKGAGIAFGEGVREGLEEIDPLRSLFEVRADELSQAKKKGKEISAALMSGIIEPERTIQGIVVDTPDIDTTKFEEKSVFMASLMDMVGEAADDMGMSIMNAGIQSEESMKDFGKTVLNIVRKTISAFIAQGVAAAIRNVLTSPTGAALGPFAIPLAAAVGGGAAALFNSIIPSFADGGFVSKPTLAVIGDARDGKGEHILNSGQMDALRGSGGGTLTTRVSGKDLLIVLDREKRTKGRI